MIDQPYGFLSSPNFPDAYNENFNCSWTIQVQTDRAILLVVYKHEDSVSYRLEVSVFIKECCVP